MGKAVEGCDSDPHVALLARDISHAAVLLLMDGTKVPASGQTAWLYSTATGRHTSALAEGAQDYFVALLCGITVGHRATIFWMHYTYA